MRLWMLAMALGFGTTGAALAQDDACDNATTQFELNDCAEQEWVTADEDLNEAYQQAMVQMRAWDDDLPSELKGGVESLETAQRAWITFRDAGCEAEGYPMRGGSAEPLLVYGCMARLTEARTEALRGLLEY